MKNYFFLLAVILVLFVFGSYLWFDDHPLRTEKKAIHMVALGDSITHGTGDPTKDGYIERVKATWKEKTNIPIQASNFAVPKYTTENILAQLDDQNILHHIKKANYIILYIGTNDFRKSAAYQFEHLNRTKINEGKVKFSSNLHKILTTIRKENTLAPIVVLGLYHPYVEYNNHHEIHEVITEWNGEIRTVMSQFEGTSFVPTLNLFKDKPKDQFFSDSLHPNPAGYQLIADQLFKKVLAVDLGHQGDIIDQS